MEGFLLEVLVKRDFGIGGIFEEGFWQEGFWSRGILVLEGKWNITLLHYYSIFSPLYTAIHKF